MALAIYVGLRAAILLTAFDEVAIPSYELNAIGNLAKVVAESRGGAPHVMHFDNVGGHLVVGWLAAPLYGLLGDRYVVLKLVPFLLGIGTMLLIWRLCRRHFDDRAAILAVLLFAFAPPTLCKFSLIAQGNHFENLFFQLLFLNAFFDVHAHPSNRGLVMLGLAAGLAMFVYIGSLLLIVITALVHVYLRGARRAIRDIAYTGPACAIGIAPLVWLDLSSGGRERNFLSWRFVESNAAGGEVLQRFWSFWSDVLPASPCFERLGFVDGKAFGWIFCAAFVAAWIIAVARLRRATDALERAKLAPLLVYLPAFSLVVALFDFPFTPYGPPVEVGQYRYLVPHLAFASILIAVVCARGLASAQRAVRFVSGAIAAIALAGGAFTLPIVKLDSARAADGWCYDGFWFEGYANVLLNDPPWSSAQVEAHLADFEPLYRRRTVAGVAFYAAWQGDTGLGHPPTTPLDIGAIVANFSPDLAIDVARGAGSYLRRLVLEENGGSRMRAILEALDASHPELAPFCAEGLAIDVRYPLVASIPEFMQRGLAIRAHVPDRLQPALHRGLGIACGRLVPRGLDRELIHATRIEVAPEFRESFDFGLGWGIGESTQPAQRTSSLRTAIAPEDRAIAWRGFGAASRHNEGARAVLSTIELAPEERTEFQRGARWPDYPRPVETL
jgi:hypothetical protein